MLQLEESVEVFLENNQSKSISMEEFDTKHYPHYKKVKNTIYIHLKNGICKIPIKKEKVQISNITLISDEEVEKIKKIIEDYEDLVVLGKYIMKEHKSNFKITPASITIEEFKRQMKEACDDNGQFTFDEISYYPNLSWYDSPGFEVIDSYIDACFVHLKDGWIKVPLAENYEYGNWYYCSYTILDKENIKEIEEKMEESITRRYIEQSELKALKYMFRCIQNL